MRISAFAFTGALALSVAAPFPAGAASAAPASLPLGGGTSRGCATPSVTAPPGTEVESVKGVRRAGGTVTFPAVAPQPAPPPATGVPAYCEVTVTLTHPGAGDHAHIRIWLPETGWTGRFQAIGGSAYAAGDFGPGLANAVKAGYAAATTDAGVTPAYLDVGWALTSDGGINTPLLENFADRSQHEMALVGKEVTAAFYGRRADYSYWNGCSTGGRQGYMEAQRHPDDFDGILANAPAINWDRYVPATLWPQVVMNEERDFPAPCVLDAFTQAAVKACDPRDGATDGFLAEPAACTFDPRRLVGKTVECEGRKVTVSAADAEVVRRIWDGPTTPSGEKLWYGVPVGAALDALAGTKANADGSRSGVPFPVPAVWVSTFLERDPAFDPSTLTYARFAQLFEQSSAEFNRVIGTDDPDLAGFRAAGGKLLTFHGLADQLIPVQGTVDYRERVQELMGGADEVDSFYRLFLAPGVDHCAGGGTGLVPTDPLAALTDWVEKGKAPDTLPAAVTDAAGKKTPRALCRYPLITTGSGRDTENAADGHHCAPASKAALSPLSAPTADSDGSVTSDDGTHTDRPELAATGERTTSLLLAAAAAVLLGLGLVTRTTGRSVRNRRR